MHRDEPALRKAWSVVGIAVGSRSRRRAQTGCRRKVGVIILIEDLEAGTCRGIGGRVCDLLRRAAREIFAEQTPAALVEVVGAAAARVARTHQVARVIVGITPGF